MLTLALLLLQTVAAPDCRWDGGWSELGAATCIWSRPTRTGLNGSSGIRLSGIPARFLRLQ